MKCTCEKDGGREASVIVGDTREFISRQLQVHFSGSQKREIKMLPERFGKGRSLPLPGTLSFNAVRMRS